MAVRIRLKKMGRKHRPFFRVCAMDARAPRDGRVIEELGTYDPIVPETDARAILNADRIDYWMSVGAQPTPKVGVLIRKYGKDGTHLDAQKAAIERLGGRRQKAISDAIAAASSLPAPPEPEAPAPTEESPSEGVPAEETAAEATTEEKTDAPAEAASEE